MQMTGIGGERQFAAMTLNRKKPKKRIEVPRNLV